MDSSYIKETVISLIDGLKINSSQATRNDAVKEKDLFVTSFVSLH